MGSKIGYIAAKVTNPSWSEGSGLLNLPKGVLVSTLVDDPEHNLRTDLIKFPAGYQLPAHLHSGTHAGVLLQGRQIVGGKSLGPDDFCYGPGGMVHPPSSFPEETVIFCVFQGDPAHSYPAEAPPAVVGTEPVVSGRVGFLAISSAEVPWQEGEQVTKLPPGSRARVLVDDLERNLRAVIVQFRPGYREPVHTHGGTSSGTVLAGRQIIGGITLERGDFRYAPSWLEHGPFDYPGDCVVFGVFQGDIVHKY